MFDPSRITVQRRSVWDTGRDEVKRVQWMFEEDTNRIAGHRGADIADIQGLFVPFSRRLSILIESHHLIYEPRGRSADRAARLQALYGRAPWAWRVCEPQHEEGRAVYGQRRGDF